MPVVEARTSQGVARVALDRPPLNVIDLVAARELVAALEPLKRETALCAVVLEGRGRAFCSGVDVRDHLPDRGAEMLRTFDRACELLVEIEAPVIATVHGSALGGGFELALVCDLVWAAESARFGVPEIKLGVFPPVAAVALPRLVPATSRASWCSPGAPSPPPKPGASASSTAWFPMQSSARPWRSCSQRCGR